MNLVIFRCVGRTSFARGCCCLEINCALASLLNCNSVSTERAATFCQCLPPPPFFSPRLAFSEETTAVRESSVIVQVMRPQLRKLGLLAYCFGAKLDHWAWRDFVNRLLLRSLPQGTGFVKGCPPPPSERATKFAVVQGELDGCDASLERCLPLSFVQ